MSKFARNPELLSTPLQAFENHTSSEAKSKTLPWEYKSLDKLFWRGSSTGDSYSHSKKDGDWRRSHRPRLHLMAQQVEGESVVHVQQDREWVAETWSVSRLNEKYTDIGLTDKPRQVSSLDTPFRLPSAD